MIFKKPGFVGSFTILVFEVIVGLSLFKRISNFCFLVKLSIGAQFEHILHVGHLKAGSLCGINAESIIFLRCWSGLSPDNPSSLSIFSFCLRLTSSSHAAVDVEEDFASASTIILESDALFQVRGFREKKAAQHYIQPNLYTINIYIMLSIIFPNFHKYIRFILSLCLTVGSILSWCGSSRDHSRRRETPLQLVPRTCWWQAENDTN